MNFILFKKNTNFVESSQEEQNPATAIALYF